jgi:hypothetical protein
MGVVQIGSQPNQFWGVAGRLIYSIINFAIESSGKRQYLVHFREQFDHGYNFVDLQKLDNHDFVEFQNIVIDYRKLRIYETLEFRIGEVEISLDEFLRKLELQAKQRNLT